MSLRKLVNMKTFTHTPFWEAYATSSVPIPFFRLHLCHFSFFTLFSYLYIVYFLGGMRVSSVSVASPVTHVRV